MHELSSMIKHNMVPALGVTEPGCIALCTATARSHAKGEIMSVDVSLNSCIYKGAFTCGIPGAEEVGNLFAAALGVCGADASLGLESLDTITEQSKIDAHKLIDEGKVSVKLNAISSEVYAKAIVKTACDVCEVTIKDNHANIVLIKLNDNVIFEKEDEVFDTAEDQGIDLHAILKYTFAELVDYVRTVDVEEISFIDEAYKLNLALFEYGFNSDKITLGKQLLRENCNVRVSEDELATIQLYTNMALEARVIGLPKPAMSITSSGAHGILATMPLYACCQFNQFTKEALLRATALSYLITIYIKVCSGLMSAYCGCAIAAGTGSAVALCFLKGGTVKQMGHVINNMAASITGMLCDGGNKGCTLKGVMAVDMGYRAVKFALADAYVEEIHSISGVTPEDTMKNMGYIADPGMKETEKAVLDIYEKKLETMFK